MRLLRSGLLAAALIAAGTIAGAAPLQTPSDLYELGPLTDAELRPFSEQPGDWRALHQERVDGRTWMLLAHPDGNPAVPPPGLEMPRFVGRIRNGERLILSAPEVAGQRLRTGRPITITPSGGTVQITREALGPLARRAPHQFRALEQTASPPPPHEPGPKASFRTTLDRASRVRPGGPSVGGRTAEEVAALVDAVSLTRLEGHVRALSEEADGRPANRWWEEMSVFPSKREYVRDELMTAIGGDTVRVFEHGFQVESDANPGQMVDVFNIVGHVPSARSNAGAVMITAHLDAIGLRSDPQVMCALGHKDDDPDCDCENAATDDDCEWSGASDPTPGADDNASGIAGMLECARILAPLDFDFDLYFVAFQAEEIGLVGSAAFADSVGAAGQEVYAVLNMDMLGHNAILNKIDIMTNEPSQWLAEWIKDSAESFVPSLATEVFVEPFGRSDHASFWGQGIDAVLVIEDHEIPYPGYHRVTDLWETMFPATGRPNSELQLQLAVQTAVASIGRFAVHYAVPDLAIPEGEVTARSFSVTGRFVQGQPAQITAGVHNLGNPSLTFLNNTVDSLTARISFYQGDPDAGGNLLQSTDLKTFWGSGTRQDIVYTWDTSNVEPGPQSIWAVVEGLDPGYEQSEVNRDNNRARAEFFLEAPNGTGPEVLDYYVYPNPASSASELTFYYELTRDAAVQMEIFDLEGTLISQLNAPLTFIANGNRAGVNTVDAGGFSPDLDAIDLQSGVYLYVLRVGDGSGDTERVRGKFALVR